jgi:ABC-type lipoprotein release transport system permease subunit
VRYGSRTLLHAPAFASTTVLTLAIGLAIAAYQPARRAAHVDPAQTLRADG